MHTGTVYLEKLIFDFITLHHFRTDGPVRYALIQIYGDATCLHMALKYFLWNKG